MLSIIIPTRNEEHYLPTLLTSIHKQSYTEYEILVVDAKSTDKTAKEAKKLGTQVIPSLKQNVSYQRNLGAKHAKGDILLFIDADMELGSPNLFKKIVTTMTDKQIMCCLVPITIKKPTLLDTVMSTVFNATARLGNALGIGGGRGGFLAIRKNIFTQVNGFKETQTIAEDVQLIQKMIRKGKIAYLRHYPVYESPRRYRQEGYLRVIFIWIYHGIPSTLRTLVQR